MSLHSYTRAEIDEFLSFIPPDCDRALWIKIGMALKAWDDGREGEELWHSWSAGASNYNHRRANESWRSFEPDGKVTPASLQYEAQQAGWQRAQPTSTVYGAPPANAPVRRAAGAAPKVLDGPPAAWADEEAARAALAIRA